MGGHRSEMTGIHMTMVRRERERRASGGEDAGGFLAFSGGGRHVLS